MRGAQLVVGIEIGAAHAFVDHLLQVFGFFAGAGSKRTSMPSLTKAFTMPVSWQMGRWPSAHMRLLMRICAMASRAAGDCSRS